MLKLETNTRQLGPTYDVQTIKHDAIQGRRYLHIFEVWTRGGSLAFMGMELRFGGTELTSLPRLL